MTVLRLSSVGDCVLLSAAGSWKGGQKVQYYVAEVESMWEDAYKKKWIECRW